MLHHNRGSGALYLTVSNYLLQDDAAAAKRKGRHLRQGFPPVAIFWRQMRSNSRRLSAGMNV